MKNRYAIWLAAMVFAASLPISPMMTQAAPVSVGDANADGALNIADVRILQDLLTGAVKTAPAGNCDCNGDGVLNAVDLTLMKREILQSSGSNATYAGLVINEICSSNQESYTAEDGTSPDWVELYNGGDVTLSLDGVGLSDGNGNRFKFVFPAGTALAPDDYLLVLCDDINRITATEYHAAFKLSASGEALYLTAPDGGDIDSVTLPELDTDVTYGAYPNGSDQYALLSPTPNGSNAAVQLLYRVEKPLFSQEGGFYDDAFSLTLSATDGCEILYTTDGSDPRTSDTAMVYSAPISIYDNTSEPNVLAAVQDISLLGYDPPKHNIDKGMVIRAVCRDASGNDSAVATNGYFIGKTAAYYTDMKVISITTDPDNLVDPDTGIYMVGNQYYEWLRTVWRSPYAAGDVNNPTNYNAAGREWERPCNIQVYENGELKYTEDVGMRVSGNWTRANQQKSFTLYARSEYGSSKMHYDFFDGAAVDMNGNTIKEYDKITLRNGGNDSFAARFRDDLNVSLAHGLDVSWQAKADYVLFIDGEFWGYYSLQEKLDDEYIEYHYSIDTDNVTTIKADLAAGEFEGDETVCNEYKEFIQWIRTADLTKAENYQRVCDTLDMDSLIDCIVLQTYICNWDWADNNNNWLLWRANATDASNPYADGKWRFMVYDTEFSTGLYGSETTAPDYDALGVINQPYTVDNPFSVFHYLLANETFKARFYQRYLEIVETNLDTDTIMTKIDGYHEKLAEVYVDTCERFGVESTEFDAYTEDVRSFFRERTAYALRYLEQLCG